MLNFTEMLMNFNSKNERQCHVCGIVFRDNKYGYWDIEQIRKIYSVCNNLDMCAKCARKADSFVDYYGKKKPEDVAKLKRFLLSGYQAKKDFSALMNGGY